MAAVLSGIFGYLVGSIPTAFLVVRWKSNVDIRGAGSGNVGALNSFNVTRSKWVGALVLLLDVLKGVVAVVLASVLFGSDFSIQGAAGVASVAGHNFPVWLKFRGGRGLATAAGVMFVIAWPSVAIWGCLWALAFALTRHVNLGNTIASAAMMIGVLIVPTAVLGLLIDASVAPEFRVFGLVLFILILVKHIDPVREYLAKRAAVRQ